MWFVILLIWSSVTFMGIQALENAPHDPPTPVIEEDAGRR